MKYINLLSNERILNIAKEYFNTSKIVSIVPYENNHLKEKYLISFESCSYILQKINTKIFASPFAVSHNLELVCDYVSAKLTYLGLNKSKALCSPIKNNVNEILTIVDDEYWYCTTNIPNSTSYMKIDNNKKAESVGELFGDFLLFTKGFECATLSTNIYQIHNLRYYYETLMNNFALNVNGRSENCKKEIKFIKTKRNKYDLINSLLERDEIPYRVNCNVTYISEIVFDKDTDEALTYINLDCVMKGFFGNDLGNILRLCAIEYVKVKDSYKPIINYDYMKNILFGFYKKVKDLLSDKEIVNIYEGFYTVVLENAIVELNEYLCGNHITNVSYETENLDYCRQNIALLKELELNSEKIKEIIADICF